jgi:hypothetical protein
MESLGQIEERAHQVGGDRVSDALGQGLHYPSRDLSYRYLYRLIHPWVAGYALRPREIPLRREAKVDRLPFRSVKQLA